MLLFQSYLDVPAARNSVSPTQGSERAFRASRSRGSGSVKGTVVAFGTFAIRFIAPCFSRVLTFSTEPP
jgi:hypothetical protein